MSTIQANAILDASGGNTTTINGVTPNTHSVMGKNLVNNGAMQIAQRGVSSAGITSTTIATADRWTFTLGTAGTWTQTESTDVPTGQGFTKSIKLQCTTANGSLTGTNQARIGQFIEAQDLQHLKFGTANAEQLTLSFWIKSNKTGTYPVWFYRQDSSRHTSKSFTISSADTWEKKTLTISGDTTGVINNDNGRGMEFSIYFASGSDYTSGTNPDGTWEALTNANRASNLSVNLADSTSNYVNVTGFQLELGSVATEFEHIPYGIELIICKRYYEKHNFDTTTSMYGAAQSASRGEMVFVYDVQKRANPTISINDYRAWRVNDWRGGDQQCSAFTVLETRTRQARLGFDKSTANLDTGRVVYMNREGGFATDPILYIDAEL